MPPCGHTLTGLARPVGESQGPGGGPRPYPHPHPLTWIWPQSLGSGPRSSPAGPVTRAAGTALFLPAHRLGKMLWAHSHSHLLHGSPGPGPDGFGGSSRVLSLKTLVCVSPSSPQITSGGGGVQRGWEFLISGCNSHPSLRQGARRTLLAQHGAGGADTRALSRPTRLMTHRNEEP